MKKSLFFTIGTAFTLVVSASLFGEVATYKASLAAKDSGVSSISNVTNSKSSAKADAAALASASKSSKSQEIMILNPLDRAKDIEAAYNYLKKMNSASSISILLTNGKKIDSILDMDVMPHGTMIIFKLNTIQGIKYDVAKIEEIDSVVQ